MDIFTFDDINYKFFFFKISSKKNILNNLIILNLCFILSFIFFTLLIYLHPSASLISINTTIFSVIKSVSIYNSNISSNSLSIFEFFGNLIVLFIKNILLTFKIIFNSVNSYSLIIFILFVIFLLYSSKFTKKDKLIILSFLISFFLIFTINLFRGNNYYYYIYTDFILIFLTGIILIKLKKALSYILVIGIIFISIYINYDKIFIYKKDNSQELCKEFRSIEYSYFTAWHKKIPKEKFYSYCLNYN